MNSKNKPIDFRQFGLNAKQITSLIKSINLAINHFRQNLPFEKDYLPIVMEEIPNISIYNTWLNQNQQWNDKGFLFQIEVMEYINRTKTEKGIFLS